MGLLREIGKKVVGRLSGQRAEPSPPRPAPAPTPAPAPPPRPAPLAPAAPAAPADLAGFPEECRPASSAQIRAALGPGPRLRVVNHWATWCEPCVDEIPLLVAVHLQLEDRADFLGVCWERFDDERPAREVAEHVADFASVRAVRYPSLLVMDPPEVFFGSLDLSWRKIPQTWVIAPSGEILWRADGALDEEKAAELVRFVEGLGAQTRS